MKTINHIFLVIFVAALFAAFFFYEQWRVAQANYERESSNVTILAAKFDSAQQVTTGILEMKIKEVKDNFPDMEKRLKDDFDIKIKNLIQYTNANVSVNHPFIAAGNTINWNQLSHTADSVIQALSDRYKIDTVQLKTFTFKDKWLDFSAVELNDSLYVDRNKTAVPLQQVIYRDAWKLKNLPPWNWGKREIHQTIKTDNPYAIIDFARTIQLKK